MLASLDCTSSTDTGRQLVSHRVRECRLDNTKLKLGVICRYLNLQTLPLPSLPQFLLSIFGCPPLLRRCLRFSVDLRKLEGISSSAIKAENDSQNLCGSASSSDTVRVQISKAEGREHMLTQRQANGFPTGDDRDRFSREVTEVR